MSDTRYNSTNRFGHQPEGGYKMDGLVLVPSCHACHDYISEPGGSPQIKSAWICPTTVKKTGMRTRIVWRCNYGKTCQAGCVYAQPEREFGDESE
jgi:hypothetical protein